EVQQRYKRKVHLINEAYSTREAIWRLEEVKSKKVSHIKVDDLAACVILETWMSEN
ncbi:Holliday junction resolvase RuvX, partial [Francisella tularensis]|uniref:Holliday junction resolvase RuvX n=1 Tax=Francisella tularensis TaxID=263 RepID=UPI002381BBEF